MKTLAQYTEKELRNNKIEMFENKIIQLSDKINDARENGRDNLESILLNEYKQCQNYLTQLISK